MAKKENIDGVLAYASDPAAPTAAYVAEKLGLPTNPYNSVKILCNKDKFREFLKNNGFNAPISEGYSNNDVNTFNAYNTLIHILSTICFSTAAVSIFNFISVYIRDVSDANYIQPIFGLLIISAEFVYCLRMPYNSIIYAAGKFKEIKIPAGIEAGLNIVISCCLVPILGLSGVAIGTLVAMIYRCCSFALYLTKDVLFIKITSQIKRFVITFIAYIGSIGLLSRVKITSYNYIEWVIYAGIVFLISSIITVTVNYILDKKGTAGALKMLIRK